MVYDPGPLSLLLAERHLPGKHDQKDHGRRKGLKGDAAIRKTYERTDEQTGFTTEVVGINPNDDSSLEFEGWTRVDIAINNRGGAEVGAAIFRVSPDGKTVHHSEMVLDADVQGQGFATRQMMHVVDSYRHHGVKTMTLDANSDVGGYAWARAGFKFDQDRAIIYGRERVARSFKDAARKRRYASDKAEMLRVANNPHSEPIDFAMVGHAGGGSSMWTGKELMLRSQWSAKMDL